MNTNHFKTNKQKQNNSSQKGQNGINVISKKQRENTFI